MPTYLVTTQRFWDGKLVGPGTRREHVVTDKKLTPCPKGMKLLKETKEQQAARKEEEKQSQEDAKKQQSEQQQEIAAQTLAATDPANVVAL